MAHQKPELEALIIAGAKLANAAFNLSQLSAQLRERTRAVLAESYQEWDNALRAYRALTKPPSKRSTRPNQAAGQEEEAMLTEQERQAVISSYVRGLSVEQIANGARFYGRVTPGEIAVVIQQELSKRIKRRG